MREFFALLRLQLLSRYSDLKPKNWKYLDKKDKRRSIGMACLYVFLVLYLGGMMFFLEQKVIQLLLKMGPQPFGMADLLVIIAVAVSMLGTLILSFFSVMSSLFLSRDSVFLASLPLKSGTILTARMCQVWISEVLLNALILLPACILFGVHTAQGALYYLRMIVVWLCSPLIPVVIATLLGTLLVRASVLFRHREILMTVGGLGLMVAYFYFSMTIGGMTGDTASGGEMLMQMITSNAGRIQGFSRSFPPVGWAAGGLLGDWGKLGLYVLISLGSTAILILLLQKVYRKLSLIQAETPVAAAKKGIQKNAFGKTGNALAALIRREIKQILRVPSYATNILPVCLMPPLMVVMMGVFFNRNIGDEVDFQTLFNTVPNVLILAGLTAFICFMAEMNPALSTSVTREGRGHDFMLGLPVDTKTHVMSKIAVGYGLTVLGILLTYAVLVILFPSVWLVFVLSFILTLLFCYICACLTLSRDIRKPKLNWVTEQEAVKQNFGVLIGMLVSFAILALLGVLSYFAIAKWDFDLWTYFGLMCALLIAGCVAAHMHLMKTGEKYYTAQ